MENTDYSMCVRNANTAHHTVQSLVKVVVDKWGGVDVLVNNAAVFVFGTIEEVSSDDWDRALGVNVKVRLDSSCISGDIALIWCYRFFRAMRSWPSM